MPLDSAAAGDVVGPGAGGIDQDGRANRPGGGVDVPPVAGSLGRTQPGVGPDRAASPANRRQAGGMEGGDLDVGAARLEPGAGPLLAKPGDHPVELGAVEMDERMLAGQLLGALDPVAVRAGQMHRAATAQQGRRRSRPAGIEHRPRGKAQPARRTGAEARFPESGRAPGRMAPAQILGFDQDHAHRAGEPRAEAGAGDSAADDQDIALGRGSRCIIMVRLGYVLESRAV